jgi:hypothetical protein
MIEPSALRAQSQRGVVRVTEVQAHPLIMAIPRFIQLRLPLPPLKPMAQSRRGVIRMREVLYLHLSTLKLLAHAVIDPSALRAAKAYPAE